jgi:hypothetical protein
MLAGRYGLEVRGRNYSGPAEPYAAT